MRSGALHVRKKPKLHLVARTSNAKTPISEHEEEEDNSNFTGSHCSAYTSSAGSEHDCVRDDFILSH